MTKSLVGLSISGEKVKPFCIKCFDLAMKGLGEKIKKAGFKRRLVKAEVVQ
jgi:hypothetical protein